MQLVGLVGKSVENKINEIHGVGVGTILRMCKKISNQIACVPWP